jgi:hypothetical protein
VNLPTPLPAIALRASNVIMFERAAARVKAARTNAELKAALADADLAWAEYWKLRNEH